MVDEEPSLNAKPLRVLWLSAELGPEAQVGGLGEVSRALPPRLAKAGIDIKVCVPEHRALKARPKQLVSELHGAGQRFAHYSGVAAGLTTHYLNCDPLFDRAQIYSSTEDDAFRYGAFCAAACLLAPQLAVDVIVANDWHGALALVFAREWGLRAKRLLVIHNIAHQGVVDSSVVPKLGLGWHTATEAGLGFGWQRVNLLKGGILASDTVATVSATHARDIQTSEGGFGLQSALASKPVVGIMNGIDCALWDPFSDPALPKHAPIPDWKKQAREALADRLHWRGSGRPLLLSVSRLVEQKGIDLLLAALEKETRFDALIIGRGDPVLESRASALAARYPDRIHTHLAYDEQLSRLAFAAADFFVMPSRFEPAGLTQMQAQRYGAVPIVRRTGGLAESVIDMNDPGGNGICFSDANSSSLLHALDRAAQLWSKAEQFRALQAEAMRARVDWDDRVPQWQALFATIGESTT